MKIILNSHHGILTLPPEVYPNMKKAMSKNKECWFYDPDLIKAIEAVPCIVADEENASTAVNKLKNGQVNLLKIVGKNESVYWLNSPKQSFLGGIASFTIKEVDTSRPWMITEYDGVQSIFYIDDLKLVDKKNNFYTGLY